MSANSASLSRLASDELAALRLSAQVMSHRALLAGAPAAALYFDSLATAVDAEQAARAQRPGMTADDSNVAPLLLDAARGDDERRVIGEYLHTLATNERLPSSVRELCRALQVPLSQ